MTFHGGKRLAARRNDERAAGYGAKEMAENETLDLWDRHSGRWRQLYRKIDSKAPDEEIDREIERCLYSTFKNLPDLLPLRELLDAAERDDQTIHDVVRECRKAREYAEYFDQLAAVHSDPTALVEGVACAVVERFLQQIGMKVVGNGHWPDMARFRVMCEDTMARIQKPVARLAKQVAANPNQKPRMPARSAKQKEQDQRDLLSLSLRQPRSGTHG